MRPRLAQLHRSGAADGQSPVWRDAAGMYVPETPAGGGGGGSTVTGAGRVFAGAGTAYGVAGASKGDIFLAVLPVTVTRVRWRTNTTSGRSYDARCFLLDDAGAASAQVGATATVVAGATASAVLLDFTGLAWGPLTTGQRYAIVVTDQTGAAMVGYYVGSASKLGGFGLTVLANAYMDATPALTESVTSDADIYYLDWEASLAL